MERLVTIILLLAVVLQIGASQPVDADIQELNRKKEFILNNKDKVLEITDEKNLAVDSIKSAYTQIEGLSKTCDKLRESGNESDASRGDILLNQFIEKFYSAITKGPKDPVLDISTNKYVEIAVAFCNESAQFYGSIQKVKDSPKKSQAKAQKTPVQKEDDQSTTSWIALLIACLSLVFALWCLWSQIRSGNVSDQIAKMIELTEDLQKKVASQKQEIDNLKVKISYYEKGTSRMQSPLMGNNSDQQSQKDVRTNLKKNGQVNKKSAPVESKTVSLYANANANGRLEFKNPAKSKSIDHVFKLILTDPNQKEATFVLAELDPEFEKAVINNKDTYLPLDFCEKVFPHSNKVSKIETIAPGKAVMENGIWTVREKMKAKFT